MKRISFVRAGALLAAAVLAACDAPTTSRSDVSEDVVKAVEALGFRSDMVQDFGDYVLVEGDIYLTRAQLLAATAGGVDEAGRPRFQYRTSATVGSAKVNSLRVDLSGLASQPAWQAAAREALTHWSGITDSHVRMVEGTPADITVGTACTSFNVAAYASFPSAGNPGSTVHVNTCFGYATTHAQKVHNMVHEFGHTLGFRHSNYVQLGETAGTIGAVHIWGTPTSGNATGSVMNGGTALNSWAGFAASDLTAVRSIYPLPAPTGLSVTNSGGYPLFAWSAVSGATSYTVSLITYTTLDGQYQSRRFSTGATVSGTSHLDSNNPWTGEYACSSGVYDPRLGGVRGHWYEYAVQANFANGSSRADDARHFAYIAQSHCPRILF